MNVVFSHRAYAAILAETTEKIKTETGGLFLGTYEDGVWYVIEAIDPGPKSVFEVAYFEYDQKYTQHLINKIANLYNRKLSLIGLWHRHPGSFDRFSTTDNGTNAKYARMRKEGALSALVNIDPYFRLTMYHVDQPCRYSILRYEVGDHLIPDELLQYKPPERFEEMMTELMQEPYRRQEPAASLDGFLQRVLPYMERTTLQQEDGQTAESARTAEETEEDVNRILDALVEDTAFLSEEQGIAYTISRQGRYICLSQDSGQVPVKLYFWYRPDENAVVFCRGQEGYVYTSNAFREAFGQSCRPEEETAGPEAASERSRSLAETVRKIIHMNFNGADL